MVEDDAEVAQVVRTFLDAPRLHGDRGEPGRAGADGAGRRRAFDVLLTDIALGAGMRGTQLATEAQRALPDLAILLMSGYLGRAARSRPRCAAELGAAAEAVQPRGAGAQHRHGDQRAARGA
jgi:DNA-binding NtrC family response regulator